MPNGPRNRLQRENLALAIATGQSVAAWAEENKVPKRTCYEWRSHREFQEQVHGFRRDFVDRAVGELAGHLTEAVAEIPRLATQAKSESVRLQAARAVLSDLLEAMTNLELQDRLTALEQRHKAARNWAPQPAKTNP
jgi:hypothetical protein